MYIYICIYIYMYTNIRVYVYTCIYIYLNVCTCIYTYIYRKMQIEWNIIFRLFLKHCRPTRILPRVLWLAPGNKMLLIINLMRILVSLVLKWNFLAHKHVYNPPPTNIHIPTRSNPHSHPHNQSHTRTGKVAPCGS